MPYRHILLCLAVLSLATACDNAKKKTNATPPAKAPVVKKKVVAKAPVKVEKVVKKTTPPVKKDASGILGVGKTPVDIKNGESNVYGGRFTIIEEPLALASAIKKAGTSDGPYKVKAIVEKVCQKKGCWFTLKSDAVKIPIRVKMKGYAFFIPKNAMGAEAVLEGKFKKTQLSKEEAQHYEDDAVKGTGKKAKKITGPQDTYMFIASAVQISKKS